ncbi:HAD superfamily hydrolase-like protein [Tieghemostelium lacteum]|uniref:HAD superfamily hydrolase-like protein n=1 Tax=Tieghemostelium lacteum TaxID=361077 RepID=A0A151Z2S1_TIELA|nr:HAD superfamily hydrolase-like protein [Tieghemostelium lacteum]|eukprot:KYQ88249.1 HAD superfamily hydrolase-like protein [Tieghemostelium lacteum]
MSYRLIALDLDGTILNNDKKVSENSKRVLQYLCNNTFKNENGERVEVVLASGRATYLIQPVEEALGIDCYFIGYNGSICISTKKQNRKTIFSNRLNKTLQSSIYEFADKNKYFLNVYGPEYVYGIDFPELRHKAVQYASMTGAKYQYIKESYKCGILENMPDFEPNKCLAIFEDNDFVDEQIELLRPVFSELSLVKSNCHSKEQGYQYYIEFLPKGINKGQSLVDFCKCQNIPLEQVVAFGDAENDIEMLSQVGLGICLQNGTEPTKKISKMVSEYTNDQDGVARELIKLFNLPLDLIQ